MLMMMRADDSYSPETVEGCTATELLACITADDYDACIAACNGEEGEEEPTDPEEVKAGTLNVTMKSEEGGEFPSKMSSFPVATYTLKAADEDINVTSIVIQQGGYASANELKAALFIDGQRVSKVKPITSINKDVTINLTNAYTIKAGKSVDVELRVASLTTMNNQFNISLSNVNSSAEKVKLPSNVKSNTFKLLNSDTVDLTVAPGTSALEAAKVGTKGAELFELKVTGVSTQNIEINSLTLVASNKDVADYFENFKLVLDGDVLANGTINGKYLTFNLTSPYVLEKERKNQTFVVKADVVGGAGKGTFTFTLEDEMDISATAVAYNAPVHVAGASTFTPFSASAGRVTIERTNPTTTTFVANRTNLYLGSFNVADNNGSDLSVTGFTLTLNKVAGKDVSDYIESVKVRYGSNTAGLVDGSCTTGINMVCKFTDEQTIGKNLNVYVYADVVNTGVKNEQFQMSLTTIGIVENQNDTAVSEVSKPASWLTMKGSESDGTVTNIKLGDKSFAKGTNDIDAIQFKVKTNSTAGIKVKNLVFNAELKAGNTTGVNSNTIRRAVLFAGDKELNATVYSGYIKVTDSVTLDADTNTIFTLKVDLASNPESTDGFRYVFASADAEDTTSDRNVVTLATGAAGRYISVAQNGTLNVTMDTTDNNRYAKSILAGTTGAIIAEYQLRANYETVTADEITLEFSDDISDRVLDVELVYGDTTLSDAVINAAGTGATFSNAKLQISTTKAPIIVKLTTKAINEDNGTGTLKGVTLNNIALSEVVGDDTGTPVTPTYSISASKPFDIVPATLTVTKDETSTDTKTVLNVNVDKGSNVDADGDDIAVYLIDAIIKSSYFTGLATAKLSINNTLVGQYGTGGCIPANIAGDWCINGAVADFKVNGGNNTVALEYVITSPDAIYSFELNSFHYKTSLDATISSVANLLSGSIDTVFNNRMQSALPLVNKTK